MRNSTKDLINFANWIETIATMAEFKVQKLSDNLVVIKCDLAGGRTQTVWISPIGRDPLQNTIISISSPALKMKAGQFLQQKQANDLLRQNTQMYHSAWAIDNVEGDDYLVMRDTHIAETMDTKEFAASVRACAIMADEMEKQFGEDRF